MRVLQSACVMRSYAGAYLSSRPFVERAVPSWTGHGFGVSALEGADQIPLSAIAIGLDSESRIAFAITNSVPAKSRVSATKLIAVTCCDTLLARKRSGT